MVIPLLLVIGLGMGLLHSAGHWELKAWLKILGNISLLLETLRDQDRLSSPLDDAVTSCFACNRTIPSICNHKGAK